ncbi:hypothetical protein CEG14_05905 [Bordetella genomosp. 1]|uniref:Filamentous haemagglutinin FhaB/tRNA nuclease CdiA-like TPS domain-containing protein n=1 Tax=Bordetella genomosp. 1 TaxID=1395607 RepID=A0A261SRZ9_9BORD|nr:hemagglutinin repeat-containing protein [Bordetella genomosp. 1]OZI39063.1 hypothetical protein CEG14_05905 [Bordetella genomosp. 1]
MNRNLHRIVFNRALGVLQVVAETARRKRPGASGAAAARRRVLAALLPLRFALAIALGQALVVPMAGAQIVADPDAPAQQRPTVLRAANGVLLVNIQTPSAAGVSRNTYRQFDVDHPGAVLNNSRTNTRTQLGGWVQGNPWLATGAARVILNEVNSSNPSLLRGYVEVAGERAQLVIANPTGISCDGCGFINAERATLTTGTPVFNGGSLEAYRVEGGTIRISGQGMDARDTQYADLIARAVAVNAGIWAQRLQVTTGANALDADHAEVRTIASDGDAPAFALDVGALGGMYSRKIVLVGTEHGVGMRNAGALGAQIGQLVVTADGRLENSGTMQAQADVRIDASGGITNTGTISAGRTLAVSTPGSIDNDRGTLNARRVAAHARSLTNRGGAIEQTGSQGLTLRTALLANRAGGRIGLAAADAATPPDNARNPGDTAAPGTSGQTHGARGDDAAGGAVRPSHTHGASLADGELVIAATLDNEDGRIMAGGGIDVAATAGIDNDGGHLGLRRLHVSGGDLGNHKGEIKVAADARIAVGRLDNDAGQLQVAGAFSLVAQDVSNRAGTVLHSGEAAGRIEARAQLDNGDGTLASHAGFDIRAGTLVNARGNILSDGRIEVAADRVINQRGTLLAGRSLGVSAGSLGGDGSLLSRGDLSLILRQDFTNLEEIRANGRAVIGTAGLLSNRGVVQAGDLELRGTNIDNAATGEMSGNRSTVIARDTLSNRGLIDGGQTRIDAGTLDNVGTGRIYGDHLAIQAGTLDNRDEAGHAPTIAARQRLDIGAGALDNREQALIFSAGRGSDALNIGGALDADHHATGRAGLVRNASAIIESLGGLTIDTRRLLNRNLHFSTVSALVGGPTRSMLIQPESAPDKHDIGEYRWEHWSRAGRYRHKTTGAEVDSWTQYDVTRTEYETHVTESAPSMIRAGADMRLRGDDLVNDKSRILAGGTLQGDLLNLHNEAAFGEHIIREVGTSQFTYSKWRGGTRRYHQRKWDDRIAYTPADIVQTIALDVSKIAQNAAGSGSGFTVDGRHTGQSSAGGPSGAGTAESVENAQGNAPAVIRTVRVDTEVPANSLFRAGPAAAGYLIETDPRFTNYRNWLSSDYLLSQLGYDPTTTHKRLGDGYYEQQLVRDQIDQLTGRRFLAGYANDEAQYRALLDAGATYARAWKLRPGIALSAAQMAQLTSDIVWLVERVVTLADGSTTRALVPQVYVRMQPGDLDANGTLMAANAIDLHLQGDLLNSGTVAGRTAVKLTADNLRNLGGRITGDAVALDARTDIDNIGGTMKADSALLLHAGRDLEVRSTTRSDARRAGLSDFSRTHLDRVAGLYVSRPGGRLLVTAGRDTTLAAARVVNRGEHGQTAIVAGRDLSLGTVTVAEHESNVRNASNYLRQGERREVGTRIETAGDVRLQAGRDLSATAAHVNSERGAVVTVARRDVDIRAGQAGNDWSEGRQHTFKGLLGASRRTTRESLAETRAVSTTFSGNTVAVQGRDVTITGSNVVSDARTVVVAKRDLTLQAATETRKESHFKESRKSGFLYDGGLAVTLGNRTQSGDRNSASTRAAASTVGATGGDVALVAGDHYQQTGSHVVAPKGDVDIRARKADIVEARETGTSAQQSKFRQSGLTVALTAPVISAVQTGQQMKRAADDAADTRMKALAAATTGMSAMNAITAVQASPDTAGGISISITAGASKNDSQSSTHYDTAAGSTVVAGRNMRISATGAGDDANLTVRGSTLRAGGSARLRADGDIDLLAARNTVETRRDSSQSSGGVGVAISVGANGVGFGVTANASRGKGSGKGQDVTWTHTHVDAGDTLTLESGGDTHLRGAVARGRQVAADVGGNLDIESLQDTSRFKSKDSNIGGSVTAGVGFAASASYGKSKVDGDFASVREQSGIQAGDGGFDVEVDGDTRLKGAVIASTDKAVQDGLNRLSTRTLTAGDLENRSAYRATGASVSGGFGMGAGDRKADASPQSEGAAGTSDAAPASNVAGQGSEWSWQNFGTGANAGAPGYVKKHGSEHSTTRSGISAGVTEIRDHTAQHAETGKTAEQAVSSLDREVRTGDSAHGLTRNWDPEKLAAQVKAQAEIAAAFSQQAYSQVHQYAQRERAGLQEKLKAAEKDPQAKAAVEAELRDLKLQERALNVLIGAVTGSGASAVTKESLSAAASEMRRLMIEDSKKFAGITDGSNVPLSNISGVSEGVDGDGKKLGGTRIDLDIVCGVENERCVANSDGSLQRDRNNIVKFDSKSLEMTLEQFLESDEGKRAIGATGGIQGAKGTLFGIQYVAGSLADKIVEAFAGPHDMIGGKLSGLYDKEGNARRGRSKFISNAQDAWSLIALAPAAPFAMSEALPSEVWEAISILIEASK